MSEEPRERQQTPGGYEPPRVEDVQVEDGPAVTAAGANGSPVVSAFSAR